MCQPLKTLLLAVAAQWLCFGHTVQAAEDAPTDSADVQTETADGRAQLQERQQAISAALQRTLPAAEQQELQAGEEAFLALWRPANSAKPHGVVILLPGAGESADWPVTIGPLRTKLPDAQWHTLSLSLPDPLPGQTDTPIPTAPPPEGDEAPASEVAADTPAAAENPPAQSVSQVDQQTAYGDRVNARLTSAIAFAKQSQPAEIILLGHGSSGFWATQFLSQNKSAGVTRLILISAKIPEGASPSLEESLPDLTLAIGDFYFADSPDQEMAEKRQQATIRSQHPAFHQVALSALPGNPDVEQEQLYRRVRGWLDQPPAQAKRTTDSKKQNPAGQRKP